ncbi:MAG: hypothetical protein GXO10_02455 [Crenarchaeota archaeon]|nr:hypothetical protein [Thermoproteota archaeon]
MIDFVNYLLLIPKYRLLKIDTIKLAMINTITTSTITTSIGTTKNSIKTTNMITAKPSARYFKNSISLESSEPCTTIR